MAQDDPENVTDTKRRFEIYVPSPKARINLGAPNKDSTGPFGYTGVSIQSDVHLFIDANKHTLFQTGQNYCGQVGGKWLQYSNADMIMSSLTNVNLSADKKVLLAAGSGQGQITAIDHGTFPRVVPYNALGLAYRLDRIQVGLYEFFHGRRAPAKYSGRFATFLKAGGVDDLQYFDGKKKSKSPAQTEAELKGGFLALTQKSLRELYPVKKTRDLGKYTKDSAKEPDPVVLLDPLVMKGVIKSKDDSAKLLYGFSPYFIRFDPYQLIDVSQVKGGLIVKGLAVFRNGLAWLRRFADVCTKYAYLITDNKLGERGQKLAAVVDNLAKATIHAYHFVELPFGHFMAGGNRGLGGGAGSGGLEDEFLSGMKARTGGANPVDKADEGAALEHARYDKKRAAKKAKLTSKKGPFDLSAHDPSYWTLTIETENRATKTITLGGSSPTPATLTGTIDVTPLLPTQLDVSLGRPTDGSVPGWISDASLSSFVAEELGLTSPPTSWIDAVTVSASVMTDILTIASTDTDSIYQRTRTFTESGTGAQATVALWQIASLAPVHRSESVRLAVDGTEVTFTLESVSVSFADDATSLAADQQYVRDRISAAVSGAGATVSGSGDTFTITSGLYGEQSQLLVIDGPNAILRGLGLRRAQSEVGSNGASGLSAQDLSSVNAAQIVAEIGSSSSFTAAESDDAIVIESAHPPDEDGPSRVTLSGTLSGVLFSSTSDEQTWDDEDEEERYANAAKGEEFYKALISWNHELQKLPEDTRNLTRPIRNAINDVVAAATALDKAVEGIADLVGKAEGLPSPPEAIGLIADGGITLGTRDRIVGAGGKGIIFIADGGSGHEDQNRFVPGMEQFVNLSMAFDPLKAAVKGIKTLFGATDDQVNPPDPEPSPSLGFRVMSDSTVDLMGTNSAQLMALGRGKLSAAGPDGKQIVGTGIARVAGSYAAELAAYRKVVISARNPGSDDKTGGRVEVAGQTIAIGGMNINGDTKDFDATKDTLFGIGPLDVSSFAGAEHLSQIHKDAVKKELLAHAWPKTLRNGGAKGHPDTQRVFVHAAKESVIQVGTYYIHVDAQNGVTIGTRTADPDPTANVIDDTKPSIQIKDDAVRVSMGQQNKDSTLVLEKDSVMLYEGPTKNTAARAQLKLKKGVATLYGGNSYFEAKQGKLSMWADNLDTSKTKNVKLTASGKIQIG